VWLRHSRPRSFLLATFCSYRHLADLVLVQTFRFSFCRIQVADFAAIDCIHENRASTLRLTPVGALCFQLTSCSPSKLMTAGFGRNRGELVPRLNRILDSVWTAIPLLRQLAVAASTDSLQLA